MSRRWFYAFFVVSGFCSLTYEVVWLRLAMAQFGVNTPFVAIVLSVFMGGIALGSTAAGWLAGRLDVRTGAVPLRLYALAELLIGVACVTVPPLFALGQRLLNEVGGGALWGSGSYYVFSGGWIAITLIPFTACMGATIPLAMWAIRTIFRGEQRAFSYLYASNVLGATAGTVVSAFLLVELVGFRQTTLVAGLLNLAIACAAVWFSFLPSLSAATSPAAIPDPPRLDERPPVIDFSRNQIMLLLFMTGLMSLGMEVVWTRQFTPYVGTVVYAFSGTLALYLGATFLGSTIYRQWIAASKPRDLAVTRRIAVACIGIVGVLPVVLSDPRLPVSLERMWGPVRIFFGVVPLCGVVGFLTSLLVDAWSRGDPRRAGNAYAINTLGCIVGPLLASFLLLPFVSERWAIFWFLAPTVLIGLAGASTPGVRRHRPRAFGQAGVLAAVLGSIALIIGWSSDPESMYPSRLVRRDYTATVVATTMEGRKHLLVNGQGMVYMTPVTKMMAHLPIALHEAPVTRGLVICFGMGTSLRSMRSWGIPTTGVELVPSVPSLVGYFHADGPALLQSDQVRIVIDDGRRFLERTVEQYDVITVDPPPPVETAGSSLLYSTEWYALIKKRLREKGIVQEWLPYGDLATITAVTRALHESFPYVRVFNSFEGWGFHFLASMTPIPQTTAHVLAERLPREAAADLLEMGPNETVDGQFQAVLGREVSLEALLAASPGGRTLTDDFPVNEYFLWRRILRDGWSIYFSYRSGAFVSDRLVAFRDR